MNRSTVRLLALILLVPSVFLGLLPHLAAHTMLVDGFPSFHWAMGGTTIADLHKDVNDNPIAETSPWVWVPAVLGEVALLVMTLVSPHHVNRHKINIHD